MFGDINKFWDRYHEIIWDGLFTTLQVAALSIILGMLGGFVIGYFRSLRVSRKDKLPMIILKKGIKYIFDFYLAVFRYTPFIAQAFFFYYVFFADSTNAIMVGTIILSMNVAAFMAKIFEGGLTSVDGGQYQAGRSLGMGHTRTFLVVILPQALRNMIPAMSNEFVNTIKATSILSVIAVADLMHEIKTGTSNSYDFAAGYTIAILMYFAICFAFSMILWGFAKWMDRKW